MKNITYNKILVTHDGSPLASAALPHAVAIATKFNAEVILLHVLDSEETETPVIYSVGMYPMNIYRTATDETVKQLVSKVKKELITIQKRIHNKGVLSISNIVKVGFAPTEIIKVAKKEDCDLIVMSTHGRAGLKRAVLGSVTDYVLRNAHCPVLVVHPQKGGE
jgi:nucleotide-binding universal stress UspA family protein